MAYDVIIKPDQSWAEFSKSMDDVVFDTLSRQFGKAANARQSQEFEASFTLVDKSDDTHTKIEMFIIYNDGIRDPDLQGYTLELYPDDGLVGWIFAKPINPINETGLVKVYNEAIGWLYNVIQREYFDEMR